MSTPALTAASVEPRANDIVLQWTVTEALPQQGTWLLSTTLVGGENGPIHQFGLKALDGRIIAAFVFDHVATSQVNYPLNPDRRGDVYTAVFPTGEVDLATAGTWTATLNLDGIDVSEIEGSLAT